MAEEWAVRYQVWLENHGEELTLMYCPMTTVLDDCSQSQRMIRTKEQQLKLLLLLLLLLLLQLLLLLLLLLQLYGLWLL
jgi:hypothetical protein